jgi:exodeoxyribonuclease VII small subunit
MEGASELSAADNSTGARRTFEEEMGALEQAVEMLERGDLSLEEAIRQYEVGFQSLKHCRSLLQHAQKRIEILSGEVASGEAPIGALSWKPLPPSESSEPGDWAGPLEGGVAATAGPPAGG